MSGWILNGPIPKLFYTARINSFKNKWFSQSKDTIIIILGYNIYVLHILNKV